MGAVTINIQNMPKTSPDYFRYFTPESGLPTWGLALTAAGFTRIAPRTSAYPPAPHPSDHLLSWQNGRVLETLQIVLITAGRGQLEVQGTQSQLVEGGMAFMLLPNVWHRYRPDYETGWTESWLEVKGPVVNGLLAKGIFAIRDVVRPGAIAAGLDVALEAVHALARKAAPGFDPELAARTYGVLAASTRAGENQLEVTHVRRAVREAERHLAERYAESVNIEALARQQGVAYSHFRQAFLTHTGFSPWRYVLHLRLTQARRLLVSGDATLDNLAARLGFSSGFHLSAAFKAAYGISPNRWRIQMRTGRVRAHPGSKTRK